MKKLLIIPLVAIMLCGCESRPTSKYSDKVDFQGFYIYVDDDTCVEYFVSNGSHNIGIVNPRYDKDGSMKLNKQCLRDKMEEK